MPEQPAEPCYFSPCGDEGEIWVTGQVILPGVALPLNLQFPLCKRHAYEVGRQKEQGKPVPLFLRPVPIQNVRLTARQGDGTRRFPPGSGSIVPSMHADPGD